jgi:glycerol-3-phosphate dehydrogenase
VSDDLDAARVEGLLTRYGTRATDVITYLAAGEDRVLHSTRELSLREIEFMVRHEQIGHLIDVLIRRTSLAFRGLVTAELLTELAQALAGPLGWDTARVAQEITHAQDVLQRFHGVPVQSPIS